MIEVTPADVDFIKLEFERSAIPTKAIFLQSIGGKQYLDVLNLMPKEKKKEANKIVTDIVFGTYKKSDLLWI